MGHGLEGAVGLDFFSGEAILHPGLDGGNLGRAPHQQHRLNVLWGHPLVTGLLKHLVQAGFKAVKELVLIEDVAKLVAAEAEIVGLKVRVVKVGFLGRGGRRQVNFQPLRQPLGEGRHGQPLGLVEVIQQPVIEVGPAQVLPGLG